jgi:predicted metalloprotease with PDZ domain
MADHPSRRRRNGVPKIATIAAVLVVAVARVGAGEGPEPIAYTIRFPDVVAHVAEVEAVVPTEDLEDVELRMATWSPGFYRVEDYAKNVRSLAAKGPDGTKLAVERPKNNHWRIKASGVPRVIVSYRLLCDRHSVTTNEVGEDLAVLNGPATFLSPVEDGKRPYEVRFELPKGWTRVMTALEPVPGGLPDRFRAPDFETLADSPILAGTMAVHEFDVGGSTHFVVDAGAVDGWDGDRAARDIEAIVREDGKLWGALPFKRYLFLNVFRRGGGGLEHRDSCLLTSSAATAATPRRYLGWLDFVSHEYFHAFNVKRLRPAGLGPFDFENPPKTPSLWIAEGLTSYYGELLVARAGLASRRDFLESLSNHIGTLQKSPGRLVQTLEESSLSVWDSGTSGIGRDASKTVSYYEKGPVVGFLLDAKVRRVTNGARSLDDVMRLAFARYSGDRGFTPEQFRATASEVAGVDLSDWFRKALTTTEELDYDEALDWFGLRFAPAEGPAKQSWSLEARPDATEAQKDHLRSLFEPEPAPRRP